MNRRSRLWLGAAVAALPGLTSCSSDGDATPTDGPLEIALEQNEANPRVLQVTASNVGDGDIQVGRWIGLYAVDSGASPEYLWIGCLDLSESANSSMYSVGSSVANPVDCGGALIALEPTDLMSLDFEIPTDQRGCFYVGLGGFASPSFSVDVDC